MPHTIVVLGAGYAGLPAVKRIAEQLRRDDVRIVLVSQSDRFVERSRLHQLAAGQTLEDVRLERYLRGRASVSPSEPSPGWTSPRSA